MPPVKKAKQVASDIAEGGKEVGKNIGEMAENTIKRGNPFKQGDK
jgi:hypothetical protein